MNQAGIGTRVLCCMGVGLLLGLTPACRGSAPEEVSPLAAEEAWQLSQEKNRLIEQSCKGDEGPGFAMSFLLDAAPVTLGNAQDTSTALPGLGFEGGWSLSAGPASFGGLSGLAVLPSGDLLAVSDDGALVEIGFDQAGLRPTGQATLSYLKDAAGDILTGKASADSEGLAYTQGLAFVSFERDHRIVAYGHGVCGSHARGIEIARIGNSPEGLDGSIRSNGGAEALMLDGERLVAGVETIIDRKSPVGVVATDAAVQFAARPWLDGEGLPLVGLDRLDGVTYSLHRAWNPVTGNSIMIARAGEDGAVMPLGRLHRPLTVDNFEGIAASRRPDGETRLFIIADNNFSDSQQTLLFVFRVVED